MSSTTPIAGPSSSSMEESHLTYPTTSKRSESPDAQPPPPKELNKNRLYVGNLHPTVDEYAFLQVFNKYGKITKLDFLFHKTGPSKGKPRGYAFIEFSDQNEAQRALQSTNEKLLRGRKLIVTFAQNAATQDYDFSARPHHRKDMDASKPTMLSLIKSNPRIRNTESKIAALEAKLKQLEDSPDGPGPNPNALNLQHPLPPKPISLPASFSPSPSGTPRDSASSRNNSSRAGKTPMALGKKPTLQELMKSNRSSGFGGIIKR